jgi:CRP-like cAMP-binding protein
VPLLRGTRREDIERALQRVPLFSDLRRGPLRRVARLAATREFEPGDEVIRQGDPANAFYILLEGTAEVRRGRRRKPLALLRAGDFFGEMALLDSYPRSAGVVAKTACRCLVLARWDFLKELRLHPELAIQMLPVLSRRIRALEDSLLP